MDHPQFRGAIKGYDLTIYQEVRLHRDLLGMVGEVEGFTRYSVERNYYDEDNDQWGGVMAFARTGLGMKMNERLSSTDILVLESTEMIVVGAYILPGGSDWSTFTSEDPFEKLLELMWVLKGDARPVLVMGDINARTQDLSSHVEGRPCSADLVRPTARGRALVDVCRETGLAIMNGMERFGEEGGAYTSHHTRGKAVVDYAMGNAKALARVRKVVVGKEDHEWSDHAQVVVVMESGEGSAGRGERDRAPKARRRKPKLPNETELDKLVIEAMATRLDPVRRLRRVYGLAYSESNPVQVYVDGSALQNGTEAARAGSGVYHGRGSGRNEAVRVPDNQSNNRAELYAVLRTLQSVNTHLTLVISSDSEYTINMLTTWAAKYTALGWRVTNGDVLSDIAFLLRQRPAATTLRKVKAHSGLEGNEAADALAKEGATKPAAPPYVAIDWEIFQRDRCRCEECEGEGERVAEDKVVGELGVRRGYEDGKRPRWEETEEQVSVSLTACRRKCRVRQKEIREELFGGEGVFWDVFERLKGKGKEAVADIPIEAMRRAFFGKMNPPGVPPASFDSRRQELLHRVAALMGDTTEDKSPLLSFDRFFVIREIEEGKADIRAKLKAARGEDGISYQDVFDMDNDVLLTLCNRCLETRSAPTAWLRTQLVGLCKPGKPKDDPNSYRAVGLESCLLKFFTLLVTKRAVEFADSVSALPDSQNGFRKDYRTNNNVFVLRAAVDKAHAEGRPLYAAFVDLTNAFPSTDHAALWLKLRKMGAGGCIFDWMRWLYRQMEYVAMHNGEVSDPFSAAMGILIGDTCSPILWALFMADLPDYIPNDLDDIVLGGVKVANLEQADDVLLMSTTAEGLMRKLRGMYVWAGKNFMLFNATKSVVMIFGPQPRVLPVFDLGEGGVLSVVKEHTYLGFRLSSRASGLLRPHYDAKAAAAQTMRRVIGGVGQMAGTLPVAMLVMLYMNLIDPHLVHGCEVVIDEVKVAYEKLEKVHKGFIRKAIGLTKYSLLAVLYTETGLEPLAYRRVLLAVGYLVYVLRSRCRYARCAMQEAVDLDRRGYPSWAASLRTAVRALEGGEGIPFPDAGDLMNEGRVVQLEADILRRMDQYLQAKVEGTERLSFLHGRREEDGRGTEVVEVRKLRHYLRVYNPGHRKALAKVMLSDHRLASRVRMYTGGEDEQKCRFCGGAAESVEHVWLECGGCATLVEKREDYVRQVLALCSEGEKERLFGLDGAHFQQVKYLLGLRKAVSVTAAYAYDLERLVKAKEKEERGGAGDGSEEEE